MFNLTRTFCIFRTCSSAYRKSENIAVCYNIQPWLPRKEIRKLSRHLTDVISRGTLFLWGEKIGHLQLQLWQSCEKPQQYFSRFSYSSEFRLFKIIPKAEYLWILHSLHITFPLSQQTMTSPSRLSFIYEREGEIYKQLTFYYLLWKLIFNKFLLGTNLIGCLFKIFSK